MASHSRSTRNIPKWKSKEEFPNPYNWSGYIVGQILSKPEYMGHTVNFRSHKQSYKDKNAVMNPPEDWLIFENTHEAIVDAETWELAQKLRKTPRRHDTLGEANPLTGLVFCADCGAKMYNHRSRGTESKPYPYDAFECSTYKLAGQKRSAACCGHHISAKALRELILETIRAASTFAISDRDAFLEKVRSASQLRQAEAAKETKRKLNKEKKRISELDTIIKKLYESFAVGRITGERFDSLLAEYEAEQKALTASVSEMETQMSAFAEDTDRAKQFLELAKIVYRCKTGILCAGSFALCKLLLFHNNIGSIYFLAVSVCVASSLNATGKRDFGSLAEIFLCKLSLTSECNASDEICALRISVAAESSVYGNCISGNRCCLLTLRITNIRVSG